MSRGYPTCAVALAAAAGWFSAAGKTVTFTGDVAPILYAHCAGCHHTGEVAPFPLITYRDAVKRAALIATVTAKRYMPPWKPVSGYGRFENERRLSDTEIASLRRWADEGAPEGDPALLPTAPRFTNGWHLGPPDMIAEMPASFFVAPDGPDVYQCFVIPANLPADKYVRALEFRPGNRKAVHHALVFADSAGIARKQVKQTGNETAGYSCFGGPGFLPANGLGGWSPGNSVIIQPEGTATLLRARSDLVFQVHYHPTGKRETDRSTLGLYFADKPPARKVVDVALGSNRIDIARGESSYKVRDSFVLPVDVEATGIIPHAHYICKDMRGWAILPSGTRRWLLWIDDWDFNWQDQYHYQRPVSLPEGTRLEMEFTYDNSAANPRNPNFPPKRVLWGPGTTDEMAGLHLQVIPRRMEDLPELTQSLWGKFMRTAGGGFFHLPDR